MNDIGIVLKAAVFAAHKLCNLRDILTNPPATWSEKREGEYFEWAKAVVEQVRGANPRLAEKFDAVWEVGRGVA